MEGSDQVEESYSNADCGVGITSESTEIAELRDVEPSRRFKNKRIPTQVRLSNFVTRTKPAKKEKRVETADSAVLSEAVVLSGNATSTIPATCGLDEKVLEFVKFLKAKQDEMWKSKENKARAHRRLVFGLRESLKHLVQSNVHCIFLARNIDAEMTAGPSASVYPKLRTECLEKRIPLISASTKKSLSKAVSKHPYISCIAVLRFPGREKMFDDIVDMWRTGEQYISFHLDQPSLFP